MDRESVSVLISAKSKGLGFLLVLLFGGFGLLYATVTGGVLMSLAQVGAFIVSFLTFGFGLVLLIPIWIVSLIWSMVAIGGHNQRLLRRMDGARSRRGTAEAAETA
jgi:hypothetical protein